jgi:hypothetical protein
MSWRVVRKKLLQYFARQGLVSSSVDGELLARVCAFLSELPFSDVDVIFIDSGRIDQLLGTPINCMFCWGFVTRFLLLGGSESVSFSFS